jgi:hypothetical protein
VSDEETTGAWLELHWTEVHTVRRLVIVRNSLDRPGITAGFLTFGDGSHLQVRLSTSSRRTVIPVRARTVDRLRLTVSAVDAGARSATISAVQVHERSAPGDVSTDAPPDGNVAALATMTQDRAAAGMGAIVLPGSGNTGGPSWQVPRPDDAWVQLDWDRPRELTTVELRGGAGSASSLRRATIAFSDGSELPFAAVLSDPARPTRVSFMPRVTTSLRVTVNEVNGSGPLVLAGIDAFQRGTRLSRLARGVQGPAIPAQLAPCPDSSVAGSARLIVVCPTNGSTVDGRVRLEVAAAGRSSVSATVWPGEGLARVPPSATATPAADGTATLPLDLEAVPPGPLTVRVRAEGGGRPPEVVYAQLYRGEVEAAPTVPPSNAARGRTLVYDEEFDRPLSISRTGLGADYAAAKPVPNGVEDFGSAIFPDPDLGYDTVQVVDNAYLRLRVQPKPADFPDPLGAGRVHLGGLLASARGGMSGFSAQYGYFETRMLAPAARGTWPAFWMLPSTYPPPLEPVVAEVDAVELYGHDPTSACHTTHEYLDGRDSGKGAAHCGRRFASDRSALTWHTYGVAIGPTEISFYIDGSLVAEASQIRGGADPMFFLVDLALGGGWPIDLAGTQGRADLYVDYVRVYV